MIGADESFVIVTKDGEDIKDDMIVNRNKHSNHDDDSTTKIIHDHDQNRKSTSKINHNRYPSEPTIVKSNTLKKFPKSSSYDEFSYNYSQSPVARQLIDIPLLASPGLGYTAVSDLKAFAIANTPSSPLTLISDQDHDESINDSELDNQGWNRYLFYCVMQGILGTFLFGFNMSALNVPQANIACSLPYNYNNNNNLRDSDICSMNYNDRQKDSHYSELTSIIELLTTVFVIGQLIGSLTGGKISSIFGRKGGLLLNNIIYIISGITMFVFSKNSYIGFLFGRGIAGFAGGIALTITPCYLGEISPALIRGSVGTCNQVMICCGILFTSIVGYSGILGGSDQLFGFDKWLYLFLFNALPTLLQICLSATFPESPKWLLQKNREDEAIVALEKLRMTTNIKMDLWLLKASLDDDQISQTPRDYSAQNVSVNAVNINGPAGGAPLLIHSRINIPSPLHENQEIPVEPIEEEEKQQQQPEAQEQEQDRSRAVYWAFLISIFVMILRQFCGMNTIFFYSSHTLGNAGMTDEISQWLGACGIAFANIIGVLMAVAMIDTLGRQKLLILSGIGMIIFYVLVSICLINSNNGEIWGYIAIGSLAMIAITFEWGIGPIPWTMAAEIAPNTHLSIITSLATGVNAACSITIAQFSIALVETAYYFPFVAFLVISIVIIYLYVPETKGKTKNQIQQELQKKRFCGL